MLERPGAGGRQQRDLAPVAPRLLERGRRGEQDVDRHVGEVGGRLLGLDRHRVVVDLAVGGEDRHPGAGHAGGRRLELRAAVLEVAVEVPDHRVGVEVGAVVEFHAAAEVEDPGLLVGGHPARRTRRARAAASPAGRRAPGPTAPAPRTPDSRGSACPRSRCWACRWWSGCRTPSSRCAASSRPMRARAMRARRSPQGHKRWRG